MNNSASDYYSAHREVSSNNFDEARKRLNDKDPIKIKINHIITLMDVVEHELQHKLNMDDVSDDYYSAHIEVCNNNFDEARKRLNDKEPIKIKINHIITLMDEVEQELQAKL